MVKGSISCLLGRRRYFDAAAVALGRSYPERDELYAVNARYNYWIIILLYRRL